MSLPVDVVLVVLGYDAKGLFALALPAASAPWLVLPHAALNDGVHPDEVARTLLQQVTDTEAVPERVCFDCDGERLQLIYRVLLPSPDGGRGEHTLAISVPEDIDTAAVCDAIEGRDKALLEMVVADIRRGLCEALNPSRAKTGFVPLIELLPPVFNVKDLRMALEALLGEPPRFINTLIDRLLPEYAIKSREGTKLIEGRGLIEVHDDPALLSDQLQEKQKESYKKGGRKAVKLYRKRTR
ncbi:MAG: hypothetical protein GYB33_12615 [Gammaproteobacteria bacterium]|nr:hypothetical protein [Gammaproteobacteria bacterium]